MRTCAVEGLLRGISGYIASRFEISGIFGRVVRGNEASVKVLEKNAYQFVREEFGAADDPYGNGMLVYRWTVNHGRWKGEEKNETQP